MEEKELSPQQVATIQAAQELGKLLRDEHPEIADDYRAGLTQSEIAEKYGLHEIAATRRIARQAVLVALKGLIPEGERPILQRERMRESGKRAYLEGKGVHGLVADARKIFGEKAARVLAEKRLGIYALTPEQRSAHGKKLHAAKIGIHALSTDERRAIGRRTFEEGRGVHGLTSVQHSAHGKKQKRWALEYILSPMKSA